MQKETERREYRCALVGRRSIPLMKYIVKLREEDGEGEGEFRTKEGTVRKVAASKPNEQKRKREKMERKRERTKKKERLEAKPIITKLPGATAADCYLVSTPTTLSPAILLPSTY